jgi:hypothetical protein
MARDKRWDVDPKPWDIIDCKLYLSQNKRPGALWEGNLAGHRNSTNQTGEKPTKSSRFEGTNAFIPCKVCGEQVNPSAAVQPKKYSTATP